MPFAAPTRWRDGPHRSRCEVETEEGQKCAEDLGLKFVEANFNEPDAMKKAVEELAKEYAAKHSSFRDSV